MCRSNSKGKLNGPESRDGPVLDVTGGVIPVLPSRLLEEGEFVHLPFIAGDVLDEGDHPDHLESLGYFCSTGSSLTSIHPPLDELPQISQPPERQPLGWKTPSIESSNVIQTSHRLARREIRGTTYSA
ncbi:hypothetical protein FB451DRAFT_1193227 [Mycena latifolia]|nr:hypothetical protein FB451DRAFT_1193227 [Mycena latifolia]